MPAYDDLLGRAFVIAFEAHRAQVDKSGAPYIGHVARVAASVESQEAVIVALLHDVVEDTEVELGSLEINFPAEIISAVDAITHRKGEPRADYYQRIKSNPLALEVKLADIADNSSPARMEALDEETRLRLRDKYATALSILTGGDH